MWTALPTIDWSSEKSILVFCAVLALASLDIIRRLNRQPTHLLFATILGTTLSIALIRTVRIFLQPGLQDNAYAMALAVVLLILGWKALFGPWEVQTKATMLGAFLFWVTMHLLWNESQEERSTHLIAIATALIPAVIWCVLFLKYHAERIENVLLLFFAGMLATVPILMYDALARRGTELQFFLFRIKLESFSQTTQAFVSGQLLQGGGMKVVLVSTLLSFIVVGLIEEVSKYWVLTRSARAIFSSIDDVMQLSIIVAIGFAFAENIINPVYFTGFVREFLLHGAAPDLTAFLSNVLGRSVLTSMVHIVSTGVLGYFLGLAIFGAPSLEADQRTGKAHRAMVRLHSILRLPELSIFRLRMLTTGLFCAIALHGAFNFLVTLPDILPGNPQSIGDIFGPGSPTILTRIPVLLLPALLYVVGGFWLLTSLFLRKENMVQRGRLIQSESFVAVEA